MLDTLTLVYIFSGVETLKNDFVQSVVLQIVSSLELQSAMLVIAVSAQVPVFLLPSRNSN